METVQGYVILKAATFETGHGFALGHNPGAPSPFVTWQFTEGENGHRDYYWGRYGTSQAWAQRDFDRRVDDYQQFYHAAVKHTELGPEGVYRYYSTQRPVDIGTYPKPPDSRSIGKHRNIKAWRLCSKVRRFQDRNFFRYSSRNRGKEKFIPYYRLICAYDCSFSIVCRLP